MIHVVGKDPWERPTDFRNIWNTFFLKKIKVDLILMYFMSKYLKSKSEHRLLLNYKEIQYNLPKKWYFGIWQSFDLEINSLKDLKFFRDIQRAEICFISVFNEDFRFIFIKIHQAFSM